ncbi:MAG: hypothetical protein ABH811_01690 [archaeon]
MLNYIPLESALCEGQDYVVGISNKLGLEVKAVKHEKFTNTCFEKAELLNWPAERVVKAVYLSNCDSMYGFVFPELGNGFPRYINSKDISRVLEINGKQAKKYRNSNCPESMEMGTCTPFVTENSFCNSNKLLRKIFFHDFSKIDNELVDISIGGYGEKAHKISLHLNYGIIYEILNYKFGERINKVDLFNKV